MIPINTKYIDDIQLNKFLAQEKISKVLSFVKEQNTKKMIKTASIDQNTLITLFSQMLSVLNLKVNDENVKEVLSNLSKNEPMNKLAKKTTSERRDDIKIVSKKIKDSHYQIDVSKDLITREGKQVIMVSCYARDSYLGRYLIKRNYFYTTGREEFADRSYDEILTKVSSLKDRYYNDIIDVSEIFAQIKKTLDGVVSEIKIEEDTVATNIMR